MNKLRAWTFGILVGLLAAGDWFAPALPADGEDGKLPAWTVAGVEIRAEVRDILVGDTTEPHAFLVLSGDGCGKATLVLRESANDMMSRMPPQPTIVWTKEIAFDTKAAREIDLGVLPKAAEGRLQTLAGIETSGDDKAALAFGGATLLLNGENELEAVRNIRVGGAGRASRRISRKEIEEMVKDAEESVDGSDVAAVARPNPEPAPQVESK